MAWACGVVAVAALLGYASGCTGVIGEGDGDDGRSRGRNGDTGAEDAGGQPQTRELVAATAHTRRLSVVEIRSSMRDLFGLDDSGFPWSSFPAEGKVGAFDNQFASLSMGVSDATFGDEPSLNTGSGSIPSHPV